MVQDFSFFRASHSGIFGAYNVGNPRCNFIWHLALLPLAVTRHDLNCRLQFSLKISAAYEKINSALAVSFVVLSLALPSTSFAIVDAKTTAVVIVDMQDGFYSRGGVTYSLGLQKLVTRQMELLTWAVAQAIPVLIFEYEYYGETDKRLTNLLTTATVKTVAKRDDNGFVEPSLSPAKDFLNGLGVKTLIMAGINGSACVYSTANGAIGEGFDVVTSSDIVGNLNYNPPIYPNNTWYFKNNSFEVRKNLEDIIN